ncbi:MAG: tRNA uracil 4-sulfurtransferase ThiI [Moraxella sp.]|uniref:tRNA uracil 4-sulfurtransferase ThiI n=1 Tax=Moraxella sp. TaxID=479 RepID=UPI0026DCA200|nr:tRNA uracil 4-sulfurtransferase ThiI [Moraxella sp.]MDO4450440.1 tRNA uracil 4-sulfurtransferase ThiI [Moraxella sp.]
MKYIIKVHPEIMMKSDTVRRRFIKVLAGNLRQILKAVDPSTVVVQSWDYIEIRHKNSEYNKAMIDKLQCTSGIHHILEVEESPFTDLHDIFTQTLPKVKDDIAGKTFCVRVKRRGIHPFSSMEVAQYVGGGLNQAVETAKVQLKNPDITVKIEIENDKMLFVKARHEGMGGFPMSTQEDVLSLISGGFDSGVASHEFIRRGSRVHYLFFNMGGKTHEIGTKQMAYQLWERYSSSHKVRFTTVDFEPVVAEILTNIDDGQMGVVLKRMMMRVASVIAQKNRIEAIVTGEALGQVASQTLTNLAMIDKASDVLVLRPLIAKDKADIIATAERIGTADIAKSMPEFCGVISKSPTVKAVEHKLIATESAFNFEVLQHAIDTATTIDIRDIKHQATDTHAIETVGVVGDDDVVIDIRSLDEVDNDPLDIAHIHVPFYKLGSEFDKLDKAKTYLLYCKKGVMSGLQAVYLKDKGFDNVKIFKR